MSSLMLRVEIMTGIDLNRAILEAQELAVRLQIARVAFDFNGNQVSINRSGVGSIVRTDGSRAHIGPGPTFEEIERVVTVDPENHKEP